jgi:hypothetical protein
MGLNWLEESAALSFAFMAVEVGGRISVLVFCGSAVLPASEFSHNSIYAEEVVWLGQISPSPLAFLLCHPHSPVFLSLD